MLDVTQVLAGIVTERAEAHFASLYPEGEPERLALVGRAARLALESIADSDALYHNIEHTTHVTLVGLEVLKARHERDGDVLEQDWSNCVLALLCHDIGYVRKLCHSDNPESISTGQGTRPMRNVVGSSDAMLMPVHVNRGKQFVEETFLGEPLADVGFINACIERTRFPVPDDAWYRQTGDFPGLVRASDLIGQLSDPRYLNKLAAIFYEFEEIGFNELTGYVCPGDLLTGYPDFFSSSVAPYIDVATDLLESSEAGRDILAHLYANLECAQTARGDSIAGAATA